MLHENTALLAENFRFPLLPICLRKYIRSFSFERNELENKKTIVRFVNKKLRIKLLYVKKSFSNRLPNYNIFINENLTLTKNKFSFLFRKFKRTLNTVEYISSSKIQRGKILKMVLFKRSA